MSRTEKDWPYWVRAEFYEPLHGDCPNQPLHHYRWTRRVVDRECDLPEVPLRHNWRGIPRRVRYALCTWEPAGSWDRRYYTKPPRDVDRTLYFHGPNRRMMRDFCVKARQEYAGCGDVEAVEPGRRPTKLDWWD